MERRLKNKVDDKREGKSDLHHFVTKSKYALIIKKKKKLNEDYASTITRTILSQWLTSFPLVSPFSNHSTVTVRCSQLTPETIAE